MSARLLNHLFEYLNRTDHIIKGDGRGICKENRDRYGTGLKCICPRKKKAGPAASGWTDAAGMDRVSGISVCRRIKESPSPRVELYRDVFALSAC
jgi:hypothetical protein